MITFNRPYLGNSIEVSTCTEEGIAPFKATLNGLLLFYGHSVSEAEQKALDYVDKLSRKKVPQLPNSSTLKQP